MEKLQGAFEKKRMTMATEEFYRKQAKSYRGSKAYGKMTRLYPVLKSSINACRGETLIN